VDKVACLCLALVDPGGGHCGEAHPVPHHKHDVPAILTIAWTISLFRNFLEEKL